MHKFKQLPKEFYFKAIYANKQLMSNFRDKGYMIRFDEREELKGYIHVRDQDVFLSSSPHVNSNLEVQIWEAQIGLNDKDDFNYFEYEVFSEDKPTSVKKDEGKLRYDLVPFDALDEVVKVLTFGAKKYPQPEENWRVNSKPEDMKRYEAAMLRHYSAHSQGEYYDKETGLPHMAHIATNALFLLGLQKGFGMPINDNLEGVNDGSR